MKAFLLMSAALLGIAGISTHADAQNYAWCAYRRDDGGTNCGFTTFDQCMADVSGIGGYCARNMQYVPSVAMPGPRKSSMDANDHDGRYNSPYRGGAPAVADLIGGQVQVYFDGISGSLEYVRSGKLRALGVSTAQRADVLPDVPSIAEFVPGYEAGGWYGIGVRRNVPAKIVDRLNRQINASLADPKLKARLADLGYVTVGGSSAEFANMIAQEIDKWAKVLKFAGIKPD